MRRRVALKVIKLGMDTKQVVARFEAERQALAMMDHPNIAKVLDAGTTGEDSPRNADFPVGESSGRGDPAHARWKTGVTGRPYFVMELVRGIKIQHEHLGESHLDTLRSLSGLATARWLGGETTLPEPLTRQGLQQRQASLPPHLNAPRRITEALGRLVQLYGAWGKPAQAAEWKQKLAALQQANKAAEKRGVQP